ncbi:MAG: hypothetical protein M3Q12_11180 [Pseudomonadota bacterium]|uniref:hypothetical protein n=1 Tax=Polaromonas sp. TaxID=1869339 RepID=UPI00181A46D2|nr:hypothetical protein [Polaromonas sp.]MBA3593410.1 hypothetical protein [Polaromonas sp.]MDQ3272710.1 hypothetical protein [Pseudomonadota bacterium]
MINLSNWRSVRLWESSVERQLRQRHWLGLHGLCIGTIVLGVMWAAAHLQMLMGSDSLALRYAATLGVGYLAYLLVLRTWAAVLVRQRSGDDGWHGDVPLPDIGGSSNSCVAAPDPAMVSGGGGDFGGAGASGDFSEGTEVSGSLGDVASGALEAAGSADEGAVVVVPVVAIFLIGCAVFLGAGCLLLLYFGWEALLTVAVELAFSYVSARTAVRVVREGWLSAAVRLTWKPLMGALFCAVALGAMLDYFVPAAHSLPHAIRLIKGAG